MWILQRLAASIIDIFEYMAIPPLLMYLFVCQTYIVQHNCFVFRKLPLCQKIAESQSRWGWNAIIFDAIYHFV